MSDAPVPEAPEAEQRRGPSGCLLVALVIGGLMAFTVIVVVSLTVTGIIGGKGSEAEQQKLLDEIETEYGFATSSRDLDHPPQRDLRTGACETDGNGQIIFRGNVTNYLEKPADYQISVVFRRAGDATTPGPELASTTVDVGGVPPEKTVGWTAESGTAPDGDFTCRVVRIERTP